MLALQSQLRSTIQQQQHLFIQCLQLLKTLTMLALKHVPKCLVIIDVCGHSWHNFGEKVRLDQSHVPDLGAACMLMAS